MGERSLAGDAALAEALEVLGQGGLDGVGDPERDRRQDKLYATIASASSAGRVVSLNVTGSVSLTK